MKAELSDRIKNLPPEKLDLLLKQLKPGAKLHGGAAAPARPGKHYFREAEDHNFYLNAETPGVLESLRFSARERLPLEPHHLEVEMYAAGLNFRDVAVALGMYPMPPCGIMPELGCDGAGKVVAVGKNVTGFQVGDEVFCLTCDSSFSRYTRTREVTAFPKPPGCSFEEVAGLALIYITVVYSLRVPGRLLKGERILIHSAAGGIGLAAVQMAQKIGAEIFATAGTEEKREYLRSLGIPHVMDSHSLGWVEEILDLTHGEGIDVVLNSLFGEAIEGGFRLLRPDGRFIELGKRDLLPGRKFELSDFTRALVFAAVDTSYLFALWPERLFPIMKEIRDDFASGALKPLPTKSYRPSEVVEAFRYMTTGKHIGRIALTLKGEPIQVNRSLAAS
jgi:NADPH:quinone reductase-like Zn-dependent oxidoreductase